MKTGKQKAWISQKVFSNKQTPRRSSSLFSLSLNVSKMQLACLVKCLVQHCSGRASLEVNRKFISDLGFCAEDAGKDFIDTSWERGQF